MSINTEPSQQRRLPQPWVRDVVRQVLSAVEATPGGRIEVLLAGDETVQRLNAEFRSEDTVTDVLSFPASNDDDDEAFPGSEEDLEIGQIAVSVPQAERQAQEVGHSLRDESAHLLVHGVLHLLGYDHEEPDEERVMRGREDTLLLSIIGRSPHPDARVHTGAGSGL